VYVLDFIITYFLNLDIPPKILRGLTKEYLREKHCFLKKGVEIWAFDGISFLPNRKPIIFRQDKKNIKLLITVF
jgi:hypothetical protein